MVVATESVVLTDSGLNGNEDEKAVKGRLNDRLEIWEGGSISKQKIGKIGARTNRNTTALLLLVGSSCYSLWSRHITGAGEYLCLVYSEIRLCR